MTLKKKTDVALKAVRAVYRDTSGPRSANLEAMREIISEGQRLEGALKEPEKGLVWPWRYVSEPEKRSPWISESEKEELRYWWRILTQIILPLFIIAVWLRSCLPS